MWSNVIWKSKALNFGQLLRNLTHCAALQTDIKPRYPLTRFKTRAVRLAISSMVHNSYYLKLKSGRN
jgi:hypothetical protein